MEHNLSEYDKIRKIREITHVSFQKAKKLLERYGSIDKAVDSFRGIDSEVDGNSDMSLDDTNDSDVDSDIRMDDSKDSEDRRNELEKIMEITHLPFERAEELLQKYGTASSVLNHYYLEGKGDQTVSGEWDGVESGRDTDSDSGSVDRWSFGESNSELNSIDNISSESMSINSDEGKEGWNFSDSDLEFSDRDDNSDTSNSDGRWGFSDDDLDLSDRDDEIDDEEKYLNEEKMEEDDEDSCPDILTHGVKNRKLEYSQDISNSRSYEIINNLFHTYNYNFRTKYRFCILETENIYQAVSQAIRSRIGYIPIKRLYNSYRSYIEEELGRKLETLVEGSSNKPNNLLDMLEIGVVLIDRNNPRRLPVCNYSNKKFIMVLLCSGESLHDPKLLGISNTEGKWVKFIWSQYDLPEIVKNLCDPDIYGIL